VDPSAVAGLTRLAEQSCVAGQAEALERLVAGSVLAARHCGALGAGASGVANPAAALARRLAITSGAVASTPATGCRSRVRENPLSLNTIFFIYTILTFRAKESCPAGLADAFEGLGASAVLATWKRDALVAEFATVSNAAPAFPGSLAVAYVGSRVIELPRITFIFKYTIHGITASSAHGHLAKITLPSRKTLKVALFIAHIMCILLLFLRFFASLKLKKLLGLEIHIRRAILNSLVASIAEYSNCCFDAPRSFA